MLDAQSNVGQMPSLWRRKELADMALDASQDDRQIPAMSVHLRKWRTLLNFTLEEVAARIGRHFTTVNKWETGVNAVGIKELELLGAAYDIPALVLMMDPIDRETIPRLILAYTLITNATPDALDHWLEYGNKTLPRKEVEPPPDPAKTPDQKE